MFRLLWKWRWNKGTKLAHLQLILYTRHGCHLCEDAWTKLQEEQRRYGFRLEVVDVDTDAELAERYGEQIPVIMINGKIRFRGGMNPVLLTRLLRAEAGRKDAEGK